MALLGAQLAAWVGVLRRFTSLPLLGRLFKRSMGPFLSTINLLELIELLLAAYSRLDSPSISITRKRRGKDGSNSTV